MLQTVGVKKSRYKKLGHLSNFHVLFLSYGLWNVQKIAFFAILC